MTKNDALILLNLATIGLLPLSYSWIKAKVFHDWVRFTLACVVSGLVGFLTAYSAGTLNSEYSIIQNAGVIVTASYGVYYGVFRGLKLEDWLFPRATVIEEAQKSVAAQISTMSNKTINDAMDPTSDIAIAVSAEKQTTDHQPSDGPVIPKG